MPKYRVRQATESLEIMSSCNQFLFVLDLGVEIGKSDVYQVAARKTYGYDIHRGAAILRGHRRESSLG